MRTEDGYDVVRSVSKSIPGMTAKALIVVLVTVVVGWFVRPAVQPGTRVPSLIKALEDESAHVRWHAALDLGKIGKPAAKAVPALVAALNDDSEGVRQRAAEALGKIGEPAAEAIPALIAALGDESKRVRRLAAEALRQIGEPRGLEAIKDAQREGLL